MSPKKLKRPQAAQQLIENLLDESSSSKPSSYNSGHDSGRDQNNDQEPDFEISMSGGSGSFGPIEDQVGVEVDKNVVIDDVDAEGSSLRLDDGHDHSRNVTPITRAEKIKTKMKTPPPFEGTSPVVTQMVKREKIVRPPDEEIHQEQAFTRGAAIDFGAMSASEEFDSSNSSAPEIEENTLRVHAGTLVSDPEPRSEVLPMQSTIDRGGATEIRSGVKIPPSPKLHQGPGGGAAYTSIEASLKQSENLRIAQSRITELERELERVRRDNESLSTAGDTLRRRTDELTGKAESLEIIAREANLRLDEEKKVLRGQIQQKDRENAEMKARVEEIETRLESNFKKIRVRERELEHRLEIVKMESATLVSTKDKMLLDLKRQIDQLHQESESAKNKSQEMFGQYKEKQDTIRRVVRALRIALTILEGDDETVVPFKKTD